MGKFSQISFSRLSTCHIELQTLFYEVVRTFDCTILEGYRDQKAQEEAVKKGYSQLHYPEGKHNHQPSLAVDVAPYPVDENDYPRFYYFGGYVLGVAHKLKEEGKMSYPIRWGGDWNGNRIISDQRFNDLAHFELII